MKAEKAGKRILGAYDASALYHNSMVGLYPCVMDVIQRFGA